MCFIELSKGADASDACRKLADIPEVEEANLPVARHLI